MTHKSWMGVVAGILVAVVAAAAYQVWCQNDKGEIVAMAPLDAGCDLQKSVCEGRFPDGGKVTLSISPRPFVGLKPLQLEVRLDGLAAKSVEVDFRGLGMNMGFNRPKLKQESAGLFTGTGMLSVCILDRMPWEATVLARTDKGVLAAPFQFETEHP